MWCNEINQDISHFPIWNPFRRQAPKEHVYFVISEVMMLGISNDYRCIEVKLDRARSCNEPLERRAISNALKEKRDYLYQFSCEDINARGASEALPCVFIYIMRMKTNKNPAHVHQNHVRQSTYYFSGKNRGMYITIWKRV